MKKTIFGVFALFVLALASCGNNTIEHKYVLHEKKVPTCEKTGYDEYYSCEDCDKLFDTTKKEITKQPVVQALGHDYTKVKKIEATYNSDGYDEYYKCSRCTKIFNLDKKEAEYDSLVIPKLKITTKTTVVNEKNEAVITKYGNTYLYITCADLLATYEFGDILKLTFLDKSLELPLVRNFSDVDSNEPAIFCRDKDTYTLLAINGGDFATTYGIATKGSDGVWTLANNADKIDVTISLSVKAGYKEEYTLRDLKYSNNKEDYPNITDEEFANFRVVNTTGIAKNRLYRSSSPVNPVNNRNEIVDNLLVANNITRIINLSDTQDELNAFTPYATSNYRNINCLLATMAITNAESDFMPKLKELVNYISLYDGTYLIHCTEGKDRTGLVCALLEELCGATEEEIINDYMLSFENYYGIKKGDYAYDLIVKQFHDRMDSITSGKTAYELLTYIGLSNSVIDKAIENLTK